MPSLVLNAKPAIITINGVVFTTYANRYLVAGVLAMNDKNLDGKFDPIPYQLLCQSFELRLKAYIWLTENKSNSSI